jgi:hypothetical protein
MYMVYLPFFQPVSILPDQFAFFHQDLIPLPEVSSFMLYWTIFRKKMVNPFPPWGSPQPHDSSQTGPARFSTEPETYVPRMMRLLESHKKEIQEELAKDEELKTSFVNAVLDLSDSTEIPRAPPPQSTGTTTTRAQIPARQQFMVQEVEIGILGGNLRSM